MRRREFITLVGGVATTAWPLAVRGQQSNRMRRVGLLMGYLEGDAEGQTNLTAFRQGLQALGWIEDRNIQIDVRCVEILRLKSCNLMIAATILRPRPRPLVFRVLSER